ncbi:MAG: hypothetical protein JXA90_04470 [Planctomycetes bacterium]|nr:hypothetical protein [Planctomycetota bacterium]
MATAFLVVGVCATARAPMRGQEIRLDLEPRGVVNESDLGDPGAMEPFGQLSLVEEIDCAADGTDRVFRQSPEDASRVETILGRRCRVLPPVRGEAAYVSYRVGRGKLLRPGSAYVLAVDYPEDAPRNLIVINTGSETSRGFHTGPTVGDALHPKYVDNLNESIDIPLSGRWETWALLFHLHDRFPELGLVRGPKPRTLTPEDGFDVTIAQFSARDLPMSRGAAVSRIRLLEVVDPDRLVLPLRLPPDGLPRRRIFWREEMSDGVIEGKDPGTRGLDEPIAWFRYKAEQMRFLGVNTYSKDLLEFGACQHWDSTPYGGHDWVFHGNHVKHLWAEIVALMGRCGLDVLPYYEYSGSLGYKGLGNQKRAKPLTRDDAYTHIAWIEKANADITDPETHADFKKMLDLTVIRLRSKARFAGIWLRPRSQLPVSFAGATLERFADDVRCGGAVTRERIREDPELYRRYLDWWETKRLAFLAGLRDHLREGGIEDAVVLFTGCPAEPGVGFPSWEPRLVTDRPDAWTALLERPEHRTAKGEVIRTVTVGEVVAGDLYLEALRSAGLTWGGWEVQHARPADDPERYRDVDGVMLTHAFNRLYTVASPRTFDSYRTRTGLAVVRHHALNENMAFDAGDESKLGYFVADIERAGPYCMLSEAVAVANGDPTHIGYLAGNNFGRGFPQYARRFHAAFLALPALPSTRLEGASDDPEIVVRSIRTEEHGTWFALVNVGLVAKENVAVRLPGAGPLEDAVSGLPISGAGEPIRASFYPCELKSWRRK